MTPLGAEDVPIEADARGPGGGAADRGGAVAGGAVAGGTATGDVGAAGPGSGGAGGHGPGGAEEPRLRYLPAIDGLRALAVSAVFAY
ncbi:MAG: hypothetical protein QOI56_1901, partial [Actinomycetota bacterium]|nr:hypothetical protein [Actinomycetota bacterium]